MGKALPFDPYHRAFIKISFVFSAFFCVICGFFPLPKFQIWNENSISGTLYYFRAGKRPSVSLISFSWAISLTTRKRRNRSKWTGCESRNTRSPIRSRLRNTKREKPFLAIPAGWSRFSVSNRPRHEVDFGYGFRHGRKKVFFRQRAVAWTKKSVQCSAKNENSQNQNAETSRIFEYYRRII